MGYNIYFFVIPVTQICCVTWKIGALLLWFRLPWSIVTVLDGAGLRRKGSVMNETGKGEMAFEL